MSKSNCFLDQHLLLKNLFKDLWFTRSGVSPQPYINPKNELCSLPTHFEKLTILDLKFSQAFGGFAHLKRLLACSDVTQHSLT